jgi:hypothetical protein
MHSLIRQRETAAHHAPLYNSWSAYISTLTEVICVTACLLSHQNHNRHSGARPGQPTTHALEGTKRKIMLQGNKQRCWIRRKSREDNPLVSPTRRTSRTPRSRRISPFASSPTISGAMESTIPALHIALLLRHILPYLQVFLETSEQARRTLSLLKDRAFHSIDRGN